MSINSVHLSGHLGKSISHSITKNKLSVAKFTLATKNKFNHVEWIQITTFGAVANNCVKLFQKGAKVFLEGKVKNESWVNKDGIPVRRFSIQASFVEFSGNGIANTEIDDTLIEDETPQEEFPETSQKILKAEEVRKRKETNNAKKTPVKKTPVKKTPVKKTTVAKPVKRTRIQDLLPHSVK
jgi:single-strand DNA-binding protein